MTDMYWEGAAPLVTGGAIGSAFSPIANPYDPSTREKVMARASDAVTWTPFGIVLALAVAVVGGAFAWVRSDLGDFRKEVHDDFQSVVTQISAIREGIGTTNQKLDDLIKETQRNGGRRKD
jgi:hypothetical protein